MQIGSSSSAANLNIANGKLTTAGTNSNNLMPLCYGSIAFDGHIYSATPNVSVTKAGTGGDEKKFFTAPHPICSYPFNER